MRTPVNAAFLSPRTLHVANAILAWADEWLIPENPEIKRPGNGSQAVCPFVQKSLDSSRFYMVFHPEVNGQSYAQIESIVTSYIESFIATPPFQPELLTTKTLLVVFPELPERETNVLDIVHTRIKSTFVSQGLMLAQFHQRCEERGIHNRNLKVYQSPYPMMSIRHMAIHDILFLDKDPNWFKSYNVRFGDKFKPGAQLEEHNRHLVGPYLKAKEAAS